MASQADAKVKELQQSINLLKAESEKLEVIFHSFVILVVDYELLRLCPKRVIVYCVCDCALVFQGRKFISHEISHRFVSIYLSNSFSFCVLEQRMGSNVNYALLHSF